MKKIIGLIGEIGSGKETFANLLKEVAEGKVAHIRFSDILKQTLSQWSLPSSRENLTLLRQTMNKHFGEESLPKATLKNALERDEEIVVLDGLRWEADVEAFKDIENGVLVYITAPLEVRFNRIKERAEKIGETAISLDEFKKGATTPNEILIPKLGSSSDVTIVNDGTIEDFKEKIKDFYNKYLK